MIYVKVIDMDDYNDTPRRRLNGLRRIWRALRKEGGYSGDTNISRENRLLFGAFVRALMSQHGFTVKTLADEIDTTEAYLTALLEGQLPLYQFSDDMLHRLAAALQTSPRTLGLFLKRIYPDENEQE
ncbi:MAG: helix-turn-helix transcriptional regulator [bacterium]|nr:helix-turn-helix transcriptional regulator [bacterium]